jgi:NADH:ubiquinone oxidoreductase subunit E
MKDAEMIIDWIKAELAINPGETTTDSRFSFELINCIGACDDAPAMLINDKVFGHLTREKISEILKSYD